MRVAGRHLGRCRGGCSPSNAAGACASIHTACSPLTDPSALPACTSLSALPQPPPAAWPAPEAAAVAQRRASRPLRCPGPSSWPRAPPPAARLPRCCVRCTPGPRHAARSTRPSLASSGLRGAVRWASEPVSRCRPWQGYWLGCMAYGASPSLASSGLRVGRVESGEGGLLSRKGAGQQVGMC
jgi:hypothetical protein